MHCLFCMSKCTQPKRVSTRRGILAPWEVAETPLHICKETPPKTLVFLCSSFKAKLWAQWAKLTNRWGLFHPPPDSAWTGVCTTWILNPKWMAWLTTTRQTGSYDGFAVFFSAHSRFPDTLSIISGLWIRSVWHTPTHTGVYTCKRGLNILGIYSCFLTAVGRLKKCAFLIN